MKSLNHLTADKTFCFPNEDDRRRGRHLRVHLPHGKDAVTETIYILALKEPIQWDAAIFREGIYGVYDGKPAFMKDLINRIVNIPLSQRAETLIQYQIKKE